MIVKWNFQENQWFICVLLTLFSYELDNGQIFSETGELRTYQNNVQAIYKSGAYTFVGPDGQTYWVTYYADDTGYHPTIGKIFFHLSITWSQEL